jgi:hypothetical protein
MALGSTQPITEMNARNLSGNEEWPVSVADNLTANCDPTVYKMWQPQCHP